MTSLEWVGGMVISKWKGTITIGEAFDNLQKHCDNKPFDISDHNICINVPEILDIICPEHDTDKFKPYHAKKIIGWYNEIINAMENIMKTEKK